MIKVLVISFLISLSICSAQISKNLVFNQDVDNVVKLTYELRFNEALDLVQKYLSEDSTNFFWKYLHGMVTFRNSLYQELQGKMGEKNSEGLFQKLFDTALDDFKIVANNGDRIIAKNPDDTLALFYTGAAYGYIGFCYGLQGETFKAAREGKKGLDYHDRLIELCPKWGDVYLSQAIFNFYASDVPWYMKPVLWILGRSGSEEKAIKFFNLVIQKGSIARYEAYEMLTKLYIRKGEITLVRKTINELIQLLPTTKYYYLFLFSLEFNRYEMFEESNKLLIQGIELSKKEKLSDIPKETLGHIYLRLAMNYKMNNNFINTIDILKELIDRKLLPEEEALCYLAMGDSYMGLGEYKKAKECFNWIFENSKNEEYIRRANEKSSKFSK